MQKKKADIRTIRKLMEEGMSMADIARKYGVSRQAIYQKVAADEKKRHGFQEGGALYGIDKVKYLGSGENRIVDPETGLVVDAHGSTAKVIGLIGDERVSAFVTYHMEALAMRQGADKHDPGDLYNRFIRYLSYCQEHGILPVAAYARLAVGITSRDINDWESGRRGTPEHQKFASDFKAVMESMNEQAAAEGILNPVLSIFWSKAYYGLSDQPKVEVQITDPLGEKRSAEDIAKAYTEVELPD